MPDRDEQFRQFQADELRRQTVALEATAVSARSTARGVEIIKAMVVTIFCLMLLSAVLLGAAALMSAA